MKKRLSVFLAAVMAAALLPVGAYADTDFPDLAKEHTGPTRMCSNWLRTAQYPVMKTEPFSRRAS